MKTSRGEQLVREIVARRYGVGSYNVRPKSLINPRTGRALELDIFYKKEKIAFEFQGSQHSNHYQSYKDEIKKHWCRKKKITLKVVWAKTLESLAKEYGVPADTKLMEAVRNYANKSKKINKRGKFKTKASAHAQRKASQNTYIHFVKCFTIKLLTLYIH